MEKTKKYWYGEEVSDYGVENGYVDYRTLSEVVGSMILANCNILGDNYEIENGERDNFDAISELRENISELEDELDTLEDNERITELQNRISELEEEINELEYEQDNPPEVFQYFIISNYGAQFLKEHTSEIVYYNPDLNLNIWGVTHWGTSWAYVLTDIKIDD